MIIFYLVPSFLMHFSKFCYILSYLLYIKFIYCSFIVKFTSLSCCSHGGQEIILILSNCLLFWSWFCVFFFLRQLYSGVSSSFHQKSSSRVYGNSWGFLFCFVFIGNVEVLGEYFFFILSAWQCSWASITVTHFLQTFQKCFHFLLIKQYSSEEVGVF